MSFKVLEDGSCKCSLCGKICKKLGIKGHIWRCHTEEGKNFKVDFNNRSKKKCSKCNREISLSNYNKHIKVCDEPKKHKKSERYTDFTIEGNIYRCNLCGNKYKKLGIKTHIWRCHTKEGQCVKYKLIGHPCSTKGKTVDTDERIRKMSIKLKEYYKTHDGSMKGRKHSEETKKKLSKIRKIYLEEHPDKVPYLLNHSSKESYPEKYFAIVFGNTKLNITRYYRISLYELDFAIVDKKIAIEIDGEQHYLDKKVQKCDKNKERFLKENGWKLFRVRWSKYQTLKKDQRKLFIDNFIEKIMGH